MAPDALAALALRYTQGMTSIRGRRVQRLIRREFAGADVVLIVRLGRTAGPAAQAVLGLSASGAALCATDGRGPHACVAKWLHGAAEAVEEGFDLLKDSLPLRTSARLPLATLRVRCGPLAGDAAQVPAQGRDAWQAVLRALG